MKWKLVCVVPWAGMIENKMRTGEPKPRVRAYDWVLAHFVRLIPKAASNPKLREVQVSKLEKEWTIRQEFLTIDLAPFFRSVHQKLAELGEARALVVPTCWGGTPIIPNMLVPVYDVSASDAAGLPMMHILAAYPGLTAPRSPDGFAWLLRKGYIEAEGYKCLDGTTTNERAVIAHHT